MRPSNKSRSRNKQGGSGGHGGQQRRNTMGNIINRVFESAGPDGKVRGTPQQIIDKYQALARDAQVSGDRVAAESYLQYAEHYSRLLGEAQRQQMENRFSQEREERGGEEGFERRPQHQPQPVVASGLAMIEPEDSDDFSGPIETPESRSRQRDTAPNGGGERRHERERYQERAERPRATAPAPQPEPAPAPVDVAEVAPPAAAEPAPAETPAAPEPAAPEPAAAPEPVAEAPAKAPAEAEAAESAEPAPAPKRRRRPRAQAPAPVVEAE